MVLNKNWLYYNNNNNIAQITEAINRVSEMGSKVNLRPPTADDEEGAARAHSLAREATMEGRETDPPPWAQIQLRASALRWARVNAVEHREDIFKQSTTGQFTRQLDSALPGPHTKRLYDGLGREKASILGQLSPGHARINR